MLKFGKGVVKLRVPILILALLLLIPSVIGMANTRINYDMLSYLPEDMDTVTGQDILMEDFGKGAFSIVVIDGMTPGELERASDALKEVEHVDSVISWASLGDVTVPVELLPEKYYDVFNKGDETLMAIFFDTATSADETMDAISEVRSVLGERCFVTGMSALVTDLRDLCEREEPIYVGIAVLLALAAMMIFMDSWLVPVVFLISIGIAIMWNMGTNVLLGEISYITKALSAVLQLAVTMDYSIFLWHSYSEEKRSFSDKGEAMAHAISDTITSVVGSSVTTIAGFIALCFMSFTLGKDLGLVMAKGVVFGVIGCVTTLPSLLLTFDKVIEKTRHKSLIPNMSKLSGFIVRRSWIFLVIFAVLLFPAFYGYTHTESYYDLGESLPEDMDYVISNTLLHEDFDMASTHMILVRSDLTQKEVKSMMNEMEDVSGVKAVLGLRSVVGSLVPEEFLPDSITGILKSDNYELLLVSSEYKVASDEVNSQITELNDILKRYDSGGMLIGEAPCTKDLIEVTDHDFDVVNALSIAAIFIIIALVLRSISLPVILVAVIEFAIFINLGIPYCTGTKLAFIAPICISTIQLGATVDYAILMTTRYKRERASGLCRNEAITTALTSSIPSVIVSAMGFFAATFGVAVYSDVDIIGSMCSLMARGAIVSMLSVIFILPSLLKLLDGIIVKTSMGFKNKKEAVLNEA